MDKATKICSSVTKKLVPPARLRRMVESKAEEIRSAVERECERANLPAEVRLDGSVAKDTWIRGYADVDIFMRVSPQLSKQQLREVCLPIAREALKPNPITERFAEHPYVESSVNGLRVNVVPCYKVERGNWLSATDRTPYHTQYVLEHITHQQRDEIRLLKAFMRGIGAYGADIKTGGFSGMLCETLVIADRNFQNVIQDFGKWKEDCFIDVEEYYRDRSEEVHQIFKEPLVVIDPVDKGRNLAAAVRTAQLWNFVAACRHFVETPKSSAFSEPQAKPLTETGYKNLLERRGSDIVCLMVGKVDAVVDILWSQLYRTQRALTHLLENNYFEVIRSAAWSDEQSMNILLFELERARLPDTRKHRGPPVSKPAESATFISKHLGDDSTLSGPWIENDRWVVQKKRTNVSAHDLLVSALRSGGTDVGVAPLFTCEFKKNVRIIENDQISPFLSMNKEFAKFMRSYLSGRPPWLA